MSPAHFWRMVQAELRAVFGRTSGKAVIILSALVPILAAIAMNRAMISAEEATFNGTPASTFLDMTWRGVLDWALTGRNFFILQLPLVLAAAGTLAGELGDNSLREALTRPVPRWAVIAAKMCALTALSASSLLLTWVVALAGGGMVAGTEGDIGGVSLGFAASLGSDLGLIAAAMLAAVFLRSVGSVVVVVIMTLIVDMALGYGFKGLGVLGVEWARAAADYLPGNALDVWQGWNAAEGFDPRQWAGLAVLFVVGLGGALFRFQRMDIP